MGGCVIAEYDDILDRSLLTKAIWEATALTFREDVVKAKVNQAVARAHQVVLAECLNETKNLGDLQRVEHFTRTWIDNSMGRAWMAVENAEKIITEKNVMRLFQHLMEPFVFKHPFSCIPKALTERIGQPPHNWQFPRVAVKQLFSRWRKEALLGPMRKRRRTNDDTGEVNSQDVGLGVEQEEDIVVTERQTETALSSLKRAAANKVVKEEGTVLGVETDKHPSCTSAEDCIGTRYDQLFRHLLDGNPGDLYCQSCWESFLEQNPSLESVPED